MKSLRLIALILLISVLLSLVCACGAPKANEKGDVKTYLNVFNYGVICVQDDWVYFTDLTEMKLYKVKTDGSGREKISDSAAMFFESG